MNEIRKKIKNNGFLSFWSPPRLFFPSRPYYNVNGPQNWKALETYDESNLYTEKPDI